MAADPAAAHLRQVVALPYPGRGHINPMLNFCNSLASKTPHIRITFILTQEWLLSLLPHLNSSPYPRITFAAIPNVLPSEATRGSDLTGFLEAVQTQMEAPTEKLLATIRAPVDLIIADSFLGWAADFGKRRATKVASFWPASVSTFLSVHHYDLIQNLLSAGTVEERIEVPGIPSIRRVDLPDSLQTGNTRMTDVVRKAVSSATRSHCILFRSLMELEESAIRALKDEPPCPVLTIGPAIPHLKATNAKPGYIAWLDSQKERSVLYVSLGSFMSTSGSQTDELAAALEASGVPFLLAAKNGLSLKCGGGLGMVVSWCDQTRVLGHPSVGGFLTHCGWNSSVETAFAGVPALAFPLGADQAMNSKMVVEDWGIGWRVKDRLDEFVGREAISVLVKRLMDLGCGPRKELDRRCKELRARLLGSDSGVGDFDAFVSKMIAP